MVLAVARATARKAAHAITHRGGHTNGPGAISRFPGGSQLRHASTTPHFLGSCPPKPSRSPPHRLFSNSKNFLARLFTHLSAPGLRVPTYLTNGGAQAVRSLHTGAAPTIKSGLSLHARTTLSSGPRSIFLPRPPVPGVRVATNVGLNTARNFSTARPIFQNIADNIPVVGRAFYEADFDLKKGSFTKPIRSKRGKKSATKGKGKELAKPKPTVINPPSREENEAEMDHYFRSTVAPVSTYLFVPMAPTPSSRVPLPANPVVPIDPHSLLPPLSSFEPFHAAHRLHATRVSSLFLRLDQANVWSRGVKCSEGIAGTGMCTSLIVEFVGWTEVEVRSVIGESGTGWCALEEVRFDGVDETSDLSSAIDPTDIGFGIDAKNVEPSSAFVMPTLDFSPSAVAYTSPTSPSLESASSITSTPLRPLSPDIFAAALETEYENPWSGGGLSEEISSSISDASSENEWSDAASEMSWQGLGVLQFSTLDVRHY